MEYSPISWVSVVPTTLRKLSVSQNKAAHFIWTTLPIHSLHHLCWAIKLWTIYKVHEDTIPSYSNCAVQNHIVYHQERQGFQALFPSKPHHLDWDTCLLLLGLNSESLHRAVLWDYLHQDCHSSGRQPRNSSWNAIRDDKLRSCRSDTWISKGESIASRMFYCHMCWSGTMKFILARQICKHSIQYIP